MKCETIREVFFSPAGTTKTVIERLSAGFDSPKQTYDLLSEQASEQFGASDLLIVGAPVYAGRLPEICAQRIKKLQGTKTPAVAVVVYGNREYDDALLELRDMLDANGFVVIAAAAFVAQHSIFPEVAKGRPDAADMEKIDAFSKQCAAALGAFDAQSAASVKVKGNSPYREASAVQMAPSGDDKCNNCHTCVKICPTHAISEDNPKATKKDACIGCAACIRVCPQHSRNFRGIKYRMGCAAFAQKCAKRKEPEIFI